MTHPRVSVVLPVYNGQKYLDEAISSILNQTYEDFELIVINDGSIDKSCEIIDSFDDPRMVTLNNDLNRGLVFSLNRGLDEARGEFVARMDADDISHPDRFRRQVDYLEANPAVGLVGTAIRQIDERGRFLEELIPPLSQRMIKWKFVFETTVFHATIMMRKSLVTAHGGYDANFPHVEDTELWSRLLDLTKFSNLMEVLYTRRWHSESICNTKWRVQFASLVKIRHAFLEKMINHKVDFSTVELLSNSINFPDRRIPREDLERVLMLITEAYHSYVMSADCCEEDKREITLDLARRSIFLASKDEAITVRKMMLEMVEKMFPKKIKKMLLQQFFRKKMTE